MRLVQRLIALSLPSSLGPAASLVQSCVVVLPDIEIHCSQTPHSPSASGTAFFNLKRATSTILVALYHIEGLSSEPHLSRLLLSRYRIARTTPPEPT